MRHPCAPDPSAPYLAGEKRHRAGERQKWCAACQLWQFDICADGRHDEAEEARLQAFYRREERKRK